MPKNISRKGDGDTEIDPEFLIRFSPTMSESEQTVLGAMMYLLTETLDAAGLTYHICGGTLIGSYRHHGMVPWDDDVDIYVAWSDKSKIDAAIRRHMYPLGYRLVQRPLSWKLFPISDGQSSSIVGYPWRYPFIDVCFYHQESTEIWDAETRWFANFRFPLSVIFPLRRRPFMGMSLWAPHDVEKYLETTYGNLNNCSTHFYSHRLERGIEDSVFKADCRKLWPFYPFVFRSTETQANGSVITVEELRSGNKVLNTVRLPYAS